MSEYQESGPTAEAHERAGGPVLRAVAAVLLIVAAVLHAVLIVQIPVLVLDILFGASTIGLLVGATLLFTPAPNLGWLVGGGTSLFTAVAYVLRSSTGIPGLIRHPLPFWTPTSGPVSMVAEILVVVIAAQALARSRVSPSVLAGEVRQVLPGGSSHTG